MSNSKRKYFFVHSFIFLVKFSKRSEYIFEIKIYYFVIY